MTEKLLFSSVQKACQNMKTGFFRNPLMNERVKAGIAPRRRKYMLFDSAGAGRKWCIRSAKCEHDRMIIRRFVSRYSAKISEKNFYWPQRGSGTFQATGEAYGLEAVIHYSCG
jgi:hypothetical protein